MPTIADQAVCIRQWEWSETSQTAWMFGRALGMVRALAKGSRRERSRFSGGIEPLTRGEMLIISKPGVELATLTAWDLQETFPALRRSLRAFYCGMYMADLVQHSITERDPHPALFDALVRSLRLLDAHPDGRLAVLLFQWATLVETGYHPELRADILTGADLADSRILGFFPALGGFSALPPTGHTASPQGAMWRVRRDTLALLRLLAANSSPQAILASASPEAVDRGPRLLAHYLHEILGRDLSSMRPLFGERPA